MQPLLGVMFTSQVCHEVKRCDACLTTRGDKHQSWLLWGVDAYGGVDRLVHGGHAGTVVFPWEPLDVHLQLHRPHCRVEIEEASLEQKEEGQKEGWKTNIM